MGRRFDPFGGMTPLERTKQKQADAAKARAKADAAQQKPKPLRSSYTIKWMEELSNDAALLQMMQHHFYHHPNQTKAGASMALGSIKPRGVYVNHKRVETYSDGDYVEIDIPGNQYHGQLGQVVGAAAPGYMFVELPSIRFQCTPEQVRGVSSTTTSVGNGLQQMVNQLNQQKMNPSNISFAGSASVTIPNQPKQGTSPMAQSSTTSTLSPEAVQRRQDGETQLRDLVQGDELITDKGSLITVLSIQNDPFQYSPTVHLKTVLADGSIEHATYNADNTKIPPGWRFANAKPKNKKLTFADVILPAEKKQAIMDAVKQLDNYKLIFDDWGFGDTLEKGRAVSMLFYGPPGTGKTMIAQAIADEYDLKLKMISTAEIESSEPGQAERNIKAYFDGAKDGKTLLFFDECDSLIADRRGIGMILGAQVNALLTSLENYEGIAIFATNRLEKMDEAFDRRLSLKLEFELPTREDRARIWRRLFPEKAPLAGDIDWDELASVEISGGYIKNVVLQAARRAANSEEKQITHRMLVDALVQEVERMTQFQDAIASDRTPKYKGGGGYGISRQITPQQTMEIAR